MNRNITPNEPKYNPNEPEYNPNEPERNPNELQYNPNEPSAVTRTLTCVSTSCFHIESASY